MIDEDKSNFKQLMIGVGELYNKEFTKPLLRIYFGALKDLTIEQIEQGLNGHVNSLDKSGSFLPKPADIRQALFGTTQQNKQGIEEEAALAWTSVFNAIKGCGSYGSPSFKNPKIGPILSSMTDWFNLCQCSMKELDWKKKEFVSLYSTVSNTELEKLPSQLKGLIEIESKKIDESEHMGGLMKQLESRGK